MLKSTKDKIKNHALLTDSYVATLKSKIESKCCFNTLFNLTVKLFKSKYIGIHQFLIKIIIYCINDLKTILNPLCSQKKNNCTATASVLFRFPIQIFIKKYIDINLRPLD